MANDRWFWQPDPTYVNQINTTNLRTLNGIRLGVFVVAVGIAAFAWATWHAVPHCIAEAARPCEESVNQIRAADFALGIYNSVLLFVGAMMAIAVTGFGVKRATDIDYVKEKTAAKVTKEHAALAVTAKDQARVMIDAAAPAASGPANGAPATPLAGVDNSRVDDERGEL